LAYAIVFLVAAAARIALCGIPFEYAFAGQALVGSGRFFVFFAACFAAAVAVAPHTTVPPPAQALRSARKALGLPVAVGVSVALLTIVSDLAHPVAAARGVASVHVAWPAAVPLYVFSAIALTTVFHFLPVAVLAWVARKVAGKRRAVLLMLGILAIAFSEDGGYFLRHGNEAGVEWARHALSVAANGAEALFIYRFGLLAGLAQRGSTYLVWHLAWPALGPA
jgi:hypothetical protein